MVQLIGVYSIYNYLLNFDIETQQTSDDYHLLGDDAVWLL
jgi:hypothetical protein